MIERARANGRRRYRSREEAEQLRADLEETLPPEVYAAAWARGRSLELDALVATLLE